MTAPIESPWLKVPEAAEYARVGHNTVYDACRTGELKARQSGRGGKWLIHRDALDTWLGSPARPKKLRAVRKSA